MEINYLKEKAKNIRVNLLKAIHKAGSGHPGGSLSATDIMTYLYFEAMNVNPDKPDDENRDKFILSKGHAAPVLYATLAERGYFEIADTMELRKIDGKFQGHPCRDKVAGVEMSTGSLGQGFSVSVGMAIANKLDDKDSKIFVLLGDGELQEGIIWEAAMAAGHYNLDNLIAIIDWNGLQIDGKNDDVMKVKPIDDKFKSFGFEVVIIDGHNFNDIKDAFNFAKGVKGKPVAIIAKTLKGKGVSFMENQASWHGKAPSEAELEKAILELEENIND